MSDTSVTEKEHAAVAHLAGSREHLREVLHGLAHPAKKPPLSLKQGVAGLADQLADRARALPGAKLVIDKVEHAWQRHPARPAVETTLARYRPALERKAREQPGALLSVAFGTGALLWLARPWRLLLRPKVIAKVVPAVVKQATGTSAGTTPRGR